jgi:hypothetical protein
MVFHNELRPHQALAYRTPREVFDDAAACGYVDNAPAPLRVTSALTTYPQAPQEQESIDFILEAAYT